MKIDLPTHVDNRLRQNDAQFTRLQEQLRNLRAQVSKTSDSSTKLRLLNDIQNLVASQERIIADSEQLLRSL